MMDSETGSLKGEMDPLVPFSSREVVSAEKCNCGYPLICHPNSLSFFDNLITMYNSGILSIVKLLELFGLLLKFLKLFFIVYTCVMYTYHSMCV